MANIEELKLALKITEEAARKGTWDQGFWIALKECGTTGCFAGNYAMSQGCVPILEEGECRTAVVDMAYLKAPDGERVYVREFAVQGLELTEEEADALFDGNRTLSDLREIIESIEDGTFNEHEWDRSDY